MSTRLGPLKKPPQTTPGVGDETGPLCEMLPANIGESQVARAASHKVPKDS